MLKSSDSFFAVELILFLCCSTKVSLWTLLCVLLEAVKVTKCTITVNKATKRMGFFTGLTDLCKGYGWLLPLLLETPRNELCLLLIKQCVKSFQKKAQQFTGLNLTVGVFGSWIHFSVQMPMMQQEPAWAASSGDIHPKTKAWGKTSWIHVGPALGHKHLGHCAVKMTWSIVRAQKNQ